MNFISRESILNNDKFIYFYQISLLLLNANKSDPTLSGETKIIIIF